MYQLQHRFFDDWILTVSVVEVLKAVFSARGKSAVFYWCGFGVGLGWGWQSRPCQVVDATGCDADEVSLAITATMMSLQILCCCYAHDLSCALAATLIKLHIYIYTHSLQVRHCGGAGLQGVVTMTYSISCDVDLEPGIFLRILANKSGATRLINDQQWNCMCSLCSGATMQATTCGARCQKCMQSEGMESHSLFCFEWSHDIKH